MTAFALLAVTCVAAALLVVLRPLLRPWRTPASPAGAANVAVYRGQLAELERDLSLGTLERAQYESARAELQRRLLEDVGAGVDVGTGSGAHQGEGTRKLARAAWRRAGRTRSRALRARCCAGWSVCQARSGSVRRRTIPCSCLPVWPTGCVCRSR